MAGIVSGLALLPVALIRPPWSMWPLIALSALAQPAYAICLAAAYQRGALALAYPIGRGTAPLLVTVGGWFVLAERPTAGRALAALALAAGLTLVATAGRRTGQMAAVGFAVLTGLCIASYSLIDARAVRHVAPIGYLGVVLFIQGILLIGWVRADRVRLRAALWPGTQVAFGSVGAYVLVLFAFQQARAGQVSTLREISVLIGLILAGGRHGWRIWVGASLVVAGALLTAL